MCVRYNHYHINPLLERIRPQHTYTHQSLQPSRSTADSNASLRCHFQLHPDVFGAVKVYKSRYEGKIQAATPPWGWYSGPESSTQVVVLTCSIPDNPPIYSRDGASTYVCRKTLWSCVVGDIEWKRGEKDVDNCLSLSGRMLVRCLGSQGKTRQGRGTRTRTGLASLPPSQTDTGRVPTKKSRRRRRRL